MYDAWVKPSALNPDWLAVKAIVPSEPAALEYAKHAINQ